MVAAMSVSVTVLHFRSKRNFRMSDKNETNILSFLVSEIKILPRLNIQPS